MSEDARGLIAAPAAGGIDATPLTLPPLCVPPTSPPADDGDATPTPLASGALLPLPAAVEMSRTLGVYDLTAIGVGGIVGAGIYVLTGQAAARYAGPAVTLSFVLAGVVCAFAALCYSELASMIPVAGSAYAFGTAAFGPLLGWMLGWDLVLEYALGASTVAVGWSGYAASLLKDMGMPISPALANAPYARDDDGTWVSTGGVLNLPAVLIILAMTALQVRGVTESARFNNAVVVLKVSVLILFLLAGCGYVHPENWVPFVPPERNGEFGWLGVMRGSAVVFFSYIGFDAISTASSEARDPQRTIPIATLASLAICTLLYILTGLVITGLVPYTELGVPDPIAVAVDAAGPGLLWLRPIVKLGALFGLTSVVMVLILGQARIAWAMADDGLLPPLLAHIHPTYHTPWVATITSGVIAATVAGFVPIDVLGEMVSIGTLAAFVVVCGGVLVLRRTNPDLPRPFRAPYSPYVPIAGAVTALIQILALPPDTWARLVVWLVIGLCVYYGYSRHHAKPWEERLAKLLQGKRVGEGGVVAASGVAPVPTAAARDAPVDEW